MKPHKHAEFIHAWADGAEIQVRYQSSDIWEDSPDPLWSSLLEYRVKPKENSNGAERSLTND